MWVGIIRRISLGNSISSKVRNIMKKKGAWWVCGKGHEFYYGDEDWHHSEDGDQGFSITHVIPRYCQWVDKDGEPCMDSSYLECEEDILYE